MYEILVLLLIVVLALKFLQFIGKLTCLIACVLLLLLGLGYYYGFGWQDMLNLVVT